MRCAYPGYLPLIAGTVNKSWPQAIRSLRPTFCYLIVAYARVHGAHAADLHDVVGRLEAEGERGLADPRHANSLTHSEGFVLTPKASYHREAGRNSETLLDRRR